MKKILWFSAILAFVLMSCGSSGPGLKVSKSRGNLVFENLKNIDGFDAGREVYLMDSLYKGKPPEDAMITLDKARNGNYLWPEVDPAQKFPVYLAQVKDGTFVDGDYLWLAGVSSDLKIQTMISPGKGSGRQARKGGIPLGSAERNTFDMSGAEIIATKVSEGTRIVDYNPYLISFRVPGIDVTSVIFYKGNREDIEEIIIEPSEDIQIMPNGTINIKVDINYYGKQFTLVSADGRHADIQQLTIDNGKLRLTGVKSVQSSHRQAPPHVFEVLTSGGSGNQGKKPPLGNADNNRVLQDCEAYQAYQLTNTTRYVNLADYAGTYWYTFECCDVFSTDKRFFDRLVADGAIGFNPETGRNQDYVRVRASVCKDWGASRALLAKYKIKYTPAR